MCVGLTRTESVIIDSVGGRAHTHFFGKVWLYYIVVFVCLFFTVTNAK